MSDGSDPLREELRAAAPPWYDASHDTWQRIDAPAQATPPGFGWNLALGGDATLVGVIAWFLVGVLLAAVVVLLVRWLANRRRGALGATARSAPAAVPAARLSLLPIAGEEGDPDERLAAAVERGDWGRAVTWLYVRALLRLEAAGALRLAPGLSDRACRRQVRAWAAAAAGRAPVADALDAVGERHLGVRFGRQPCDADTYAALAAADAAASERLRAEAVP